MKFKKYHFKVFTFAFVIIFIFTQIVYLRFPLQTHSISNDCLYFHRYFKILNHTPTIYIITPTYFRLVQEAELTRLGQTLAHIFNVHWILIEDSNHLTKLVTDFVKRFFKFIDKYQTNFKITQLYVETPKYLKLKPNDASWNKPRGVLQRNKGLQWLRDNKAEVDSKGVLYFADDDNTYDVRIFDEMRDTKKVSVWPVGLVGQMMVEKPLLNSQGKVVGWNAVWGKHRPYAIDMAGFAINMTLILNHPNAYFNTSSSRGFQESFLLNQLISGLQDLEPKAENCSLVLVWHTRAEKFKVRKEKKKV